LGAVLIGGFLVVILVPATAQLRDGSKEAACIHNLMRIGYANAVYAGEHVSDPALPVHPLQFSQCGQNHTGLCSSPSFIGAYEWGGKSGIGRPGFINYPGAVGSKYGTSAGFGPPRRPLNAILYKAAFFDGWAEDRFNLTQAYLDTQLDLTTNQCPADTGYTGAHFPDFRDLQLSSYDHFGTSYTANMFMINVPGGLVGEGFMVGEMGSNSPYLHRLSEIRAPARTLAYYENNGRFAWSAAPTPPDCDWIGPEIPGTVRGWHGKDWTFNATFMDGHADRIFMRSFQPELVFEDPDKQENRRCVIIRGFGWQKDTAPLEPARTYLSYPGPGRPSWEGGIE